MSFDRTRLDEWDDYDGAAGYSHQGGAETDIDPYQAFAEMRKLGDILPTDLHRELGLDREVSTTIAQGGWIAANPETVFSAVTYDAVSAVLRSPEFDNSAHARAYDAVLGRTLIALDGDEHRIMRTLAMKPFGRRALQTWEESVIRPAALAGIRYLAKQLAREGQGDLMAHFVRTYPAEVIVRILGLDEEYVERFTNLALAMITFSRPTIAARASALVHDWVVTLADQARTRPVGDTLLSQLAHNTDGRDSLSSEDISSLIRLLFVGGFETTRKALGNLFVGLFAAAQWEELRQNPKSVPAAVEEGLRWQTSALGAPRVARSDIELFGVRIPRGGTVLCFLASANRDEARWPDADRFDLTRPRLAHATFGFGPHACLGMQLGRSELSIALDGVLSELPPLQLHAAQAPEALIRGLASRGPHSIPVRAAGAEHGALSTAPCLYGAGPKSEVRPHGSENLR